MRRPPIYFVSDTHLGDGSGSDRFRYRDQLLGLLQRITAEPVAHLVLLGDFMELWASSMEPVLSYHAPIFHALADLAARHTVTYVVGNHDCLPWYYYLGTQLGPIRIAERFTTEDGALVALHGHQYDPFNRVSVEPSGDVKAPWSRILVEAIGLVGRLGGVEAGEAIARVGDQVTAIFQRESPGERGYPLAERIYVDAAKQLMGEGHRFVVMGHTHHPLALPFGRNRYVNTGSWVWDRYPPTYARYAGGRLELLEANTHTPYTETPAT